jgi:dihydrofolate reductase
MRKIINSTYITLDGVIQDPQDWPALSSFTGDGNAIQTELLQSCDAVLMGRQTYEGFAPVWMGRSGDPYTDHINAMTKYVVSTTLRDPQWTNTTVIDNEPIETIRRLKEQPGADIVQYGFGRLAYELMAHGLLDELRLWVHPFFVGGDASSVMFQPTKLAMFDLVGNAALDTGTVILSYRYNPTSRR